MLLRALLPLKPHGFSFLQPLSGDYLAIDFFCPSLPVRAVKL
jgi:hypothetical protein